MRHTAYLEMLSNDSKHPCYFSDTETYETLYINEAMEDLLTNHDQYDSYRGKPCYRVLHGVSEPCSFCPNAQASPFEFMEHSVYNGCTQGYFRVHTTLMNLDGRVVNMSKYFPGSVTQPMYPLTFEYAMTQCAHILNQKRDTPHLVESFLALLGQFYGAEQSFILELDKGVLHESYVWQEQPNERGMEQLKNPESLDQFMAWLDYHYDLDVAEINTQVHKYKDNSLEMAILRSYSAKNLAVSPLKNPKGDLFGFVGVSNRRCTIFDYRLLKAVSRFVQESFSAISMEQELKKLNNLDLLTGFYNRNRYSDYVKELQNNIPESLGILFINLNGLRKTNEFFGYDVGDIQILKAVTQLKEHFHEDFYRISGDEFICFFPNYQRQQFTQRVTALQSELKETKNASYSVGSAWDTGNYEVLQLVSKADTVMYINKQEYYFNTMNDPQEITESILQDLLSALQNEEFLVYLQPKVRLSTGKVSGAEALVRRFDKKNQKMIYPDSFIPLYEKNSIIRHVDLFVLDSVCQILTKWRDHSRVPISVNLSRITLTEYDIVQTVTEICDKYEVPHELIMLEVTERVGLVENEVSNTLVEDFQAEGFKISLDDFGCAYSNIVTLAQISVDEVKIDKSLVDNLVINPKNKIILENMIHMCNSLKNTTTLAEGIEVENQADSLRDLHCDYGQGYLYSKPIPHEEFYQLYISKTKCIDVSTEDS